jgi:hypothetical protein
MLPCSTNALIVASRLAHSAVDMMHSAACHQYKNDDAGLLKHKAERGRSGGESQPIRMVGIAWRMMIMNSEVIARARFGQATSQGTVGKHGI